MEFKTFVFYFLSAIMVFASLRVITARNPVHAALFLVLAFFTASGVWLLLQAEFLAISLVLVYVGAVMVLFIFIIMLLDLKTGSKRAKPAAPIIAALSLAIAFVVQLVGVLSHTTDTAAPALDPATLAQASGELVATGTIAASGKIATALNAGSLPDVHLIGRALFTDYNLPLQILGVLLLVATVGAVTLSKKTQDS